MKYDKQGIAERLKELRLKNRFEQIEVAERLGYKSDTSISKWENGKNLPNGKRLTQLALLFNTSTDYILSGKENNISNINSIYQKLNNQRKENIYNFAKNQLKQQEEQSNVVQADFSIKEDSSVYSLEQYRNKIKQEWRGYVSAGTGEFLFDEQVEYVEFDENEVPDRADFCLTVNGNSMEPIFKDGSYIFVEEKKEIPSGTIGVVIIDGEAFIKRVWFEGSQARLESFNKSYKDIIVTRNDSFKIIGKVVM